jgi:hypothetical protein
VPTERDNGIASEARRLALEIIAALVNVKGIAAERVLRPAGVPDDLIIRFLNDRNPTTGRKATKREMGVILLDEATKRGSERAITDKLIEIAADWSDFHLAQDEIMARGLAQKARSLRSDLAATRIRLAAEQNERRQNAEKAERREREDAERRQHDLLLQQFDAASQDGDAQRRGYFLEDLLSRTFALHGIEVNKSFRRNAGGEQIDAAFRLDGWHYLVEGRWRLGAADIRQLDGLTGQIGRSGHQTMGLFLAINGWSENVVPLLKQNGEKRVILMDGYDLRCVLARQVGLRRLLIAKISALNLSAEPFLSVGKLLEEGS